MQISNVTKTQGVTECERIRKMEILLCYYFIIIIKERTMEE